MRETKFTMSKFLNIQLESDIDWVKSCNDRKDKALGELAHYVFDCIGLQKTIVPEKAFELLQQLELELYKTSQFQPNDLYDYMRIRDLIAELKKYIWSRGKVIEKMIDIFPNHSTTKVALKRETQKVRANAGPDYYVFLNRPFHKEWIPQEN